MITKQTSANSAKFAELFANVNQAFASTMGRKYAPTNEDGSIIKIATLDEYFAHIENIKNMVLDLSSASGRDKVISDKLLILPLDENDFAIDADSRKISIPASFSKNGVGVAGDHFVETLYFTIDRYFDTIDFADDSIQAIVEWQNADGDKYYSPAWTKVLDDDEEKVIIGWVLTDKATSKAGIIKFSVRLFRLESGKLQTSFGTLITSVAINPSMNFNLATADKDHALSEFGAITDNSESVRAKLFNRMRNSPDLNKTKTDVEMPTYIVRYYKATPDEKGNVELKLEGATADELIEADAGDTLLVFAETNVGDITYEWSDNTKLETSIAYVPLKTYREGTWYVWNEGGYYTLANDASAETVKDGKYFVKVGKAVIKSGGDVTTHTPSNSNDKVDTDYYCLAKNSAYGYVNPEYYSDLTGKDEEKRIGKVHVPGPVDFAIEDLASPVALSNNKATLTISDIIGTKEEASYEWSKAEFGSGDFVAIDNSNATSYEVTDEGKYQVKVTHTRNGASVNKTFTNPVVVYAPLIKPDSGTTSTDKSFTKGSVVDQKVELTIKGNYAAYGWHWELNGVSLEGTAVSAVEYSDGMKIYPVLPASVITMTGNYKLIIDAKKTGFEGAENIYDTYSYTYTYIVRDPDDS